MMMMMMVVVVVHVCGRATAGGVERLVENINARDRHMRRLVGRVTETDIIPPGLNVTPE